MTGFILFPNWATRLAIRQRMLRDVAMRCGIDSHDCGVATLRSCAKSGGAGFQPTPLNAPSDRDCGSINRASMVPQCGISLVHHNARESS